MSYSNLELMQRIFEIFADELEFYSATGVVVEVNEENKTCRVELDNGDPDIFKVKYVVNASSNQGMQMKPKVGSQVSIAYLTNDVGVVTQMQEFDELVFDAGESSIAQATKTADKIKQLEDQINDILTKLKAHTHPYLNVVAAATTSPSTEFTTTQPISPTTEEGDINYDKIKIP